MQRLEKDTNRLREWVLHHVASDRFSYGVVWRGFLKPERQKREAYSWHVVWGMDARLSTLGLDYQVNGYWNDSRSAFCFSWNLIWA